MLLHLCSSLFYNLLKTWKRQNGQTLFNVTKVTGVAFIWRTRKVKYYVSESTEHTVLERRNQSQRQMKKQYQHYCMYTRNTIGVINRRYRGYALTRRCLYPPLIYVAQCT